jgi:lambda family phage tail tape measure protein
MAANESTLTLTLKVNDQGTVTIEKFQRQVDQASQSVTGMGKALTVISWDAITSLIMKVYGALKKIYELGQQGAMLLQIELGFKNAATAAGASSEAMLASLNKATGGMVSDAALIQSAMKGLAEGLKPDQIIQIAEAATVLAQRAGVPVQEAFSTMLESITDLRTRGLKQFGIDASQAYKDFAEAYGRSEATLTDFGKKLAITYEALKKASEAQKSLGTTTNETSSNMQKAGKFFTDVWNGFLKVMAAVAVGIGTFFKGIWTAISDFISWLPNQLDKLSKIPIVQKILSLGGGPMSEGEKQALLQAGGVPTGEAPATGIPTPPSLATTMPTIAAPKLGGAAPTGAFGENIVGQAKDLDAQIKMLSYDYQDIWTKLQMINLEQEKALKEAKASGADTSLIYDEFQAKRLKAWRDEGDRIKDLDTNFGKVLASAENISDASQSWVDSIEQLPKGYATIGGVTKSLADWEAGKLRTLQQENLELEKQVAISQAARQVQVNLGTMRSTQAELLNYSDNQKILKSQINLEEERLKKLNEMKAPLADIYAEEDKITGLKKQQAVLEEQIKEARLIESGTGLQGFVAGLKQYVTQAGTAYTQMKDMATQVAQGMASAFTNFFNSMFDKTKSWADKIKALLADLLKAVMNVIAKLMAQQLVTSAISGIGSLFGSGGGGGGYASELGAGIGMPATAAWYQHGTDYVPQTGLAFLHQGEAVIPAQENAASGRGGNYTVINHVVIPDPTTFVKVYGGVVKKMSEQAIADVQRYNKSAGRS